VTGRCFALELVLLTALDAASAQTRPNLLVVLTDQQRVDTMKAYGNSKIRTPNLDRLAGRSFVFDSFYVGQPLCTPSRGTLLTGLYPHTHGSWENNIALDRKLPILNEMVKDPAYVSGFFGKWHLGDELSGQGRFTEFDSTELYGMSGKSPTPTGYQRFLVARGVKPDTPAGHSRDLANRLPKELSKPAYLAKIGTEFLDRHRSQPFILYLSFLEPHAFADHDWGPPFTNVNDDLYRPEEMEVPATFFEDMDPTVSYQKRMWRVSLQRGEFPIAYPQTILEYKQAKARYWGLVTLVDEMVGRVLDRVRELGLEEDTIVVFTSDHGEMMGDHRLMSKSVTYEESVKVPLLIRVPGATRTVRVTGPAAQVDVVPTLLELLGQPRRCAAARRGPAGTSWSRATFAGTRRANASGWSSTSTTSARSSLRIAGSSR
jgi:arylsulfatase A-like enzyme